MFGKKEVTAEELLKLFSALSDEEKQKFLGEVTPKEKESPEDGGEASEEEENPNTEPADTADASGEEAAGNNGEGVATEQTSDKTEEQPSGQPAEEPVVPDPQTQDNVAEILEGLGTRVQAIEEALKELNDLKELMQNYTAAQADKIGYKGTVPGAKKDYGEMSAEELKKDILSGRQ